MRAIRILGVLAISLVLAWWWGSDPSVGEAVEPGSEGKGPTVSGSTAAETSDETRRSALPSAVGIEGAEGEAEGAGDPSGSVVVQLVDGGGNPLDGVDVILSILEPSRSASHVCVVSDVLGEVRIPDEDAGLRRCVEPPFVDAVPSRIVLEPGPAPRDPLRFVVEPTGMVEGVLRDLEGREVEEPVTIQLANEYGRDPASRPESEGWFARREANGSRVRFARVGLGRRYWLSGRGAGLAFGSGRFEGPARAGETVTAEVNCAPLASAKLVLVDERGEPVANRAFEILRAIGPMMSPADVLAAGETDGGGAAEVTIEPRALAAQVSKPVHEVRVVVREAPDRWRTGSVPISSSSTDERGRGRQDLGRITVVAAPVLVAGRVVDARGAPVARAMVHLFSRRDRDSYSLTWPTDPLTDGEGRFSFWSSTTFDGIQLMANAPSRQRAKVGNVRGGSTGVVIEMSDAARLRGHLLAPEGVVFRYPAEVALERRDSREERSTIQLEVLPDGSFETSDLQPGEWDVSFDFLGLRRFERRGIRLGPLEEVDLGEIDLRPGLPTVTVHVVDEHGAPLEALVTPKSREGVEPIEQETSRDGRAVFATRGQPLAVRVSAETRRAIEIENVLGSRTVVLPRGIPVEFRLPGDLPPLSEHQHMILVVEEESPATHGVIVCDMFGTRQTEFLGTQRSGPARAGETWTLHLPHPGSYMWTMRVVDTRRPHQWIWSLKHYAGPFTVDERGTAHPIQTDVEAAELVEALRAAALDR